MPSTRLNPQDLTKLKAYLLKTVRDSLEASGRQNPGPAEARPLLQRAYARTGLDLEADLRQQVFSEVLEALTPNAPTAPQAASTGGRKAVARPDQPSDFGPIQSLLDDNSVTEIMVNGPQNVYVERQGKLLPTEVHFRNNQHIVDLIHSIIDPLGRHIDERHPAVDARLPDGSRVNAVIPPASIDGPALTIRKFSTDKLGVEDLVRFGSLTESMAEFLKACVSSHLNIIISGGTGSGKTSLLNILSSFIPTKERIVTIEDAAELQLQQDHVVRLETTPASYDGEGGMTVRALVRNALRMRPDRIVVGEVRGGEALDMLQAMNTGHDGSMTTLHANTPRDAISRLETMALMAGMELPILIARQQIASAVDVVVQQSRLTDGSRKVTHISEVAGMEGDTVVMTDVFRFEQTGTDSEGKVLGQLEPTGIRPIFMSRLETAGFSLGASIFMKGGGGQPSASQHQR